MEESLDKPNLVVSMDVMGKGDETPARQAQTVLVLEPRMLKLDFAFSNATNAAIREGTVDNPSWPAEGLIVGADK